MKNAIPPYFRADYDIPVVAAIQALIRGEATPDQQKQAMNWIINQACGTYNTSFDPESDRCTAFSEGRRFVGTTLVKLNTLNLAALQKVKTND